MNRLTAVSINVFVSTWAVRPPSLISGAEPRQRRQQWLDVSRRRRPAEVEPLRELATERLHVLERPGVLDPLGDDFEVVGVRQLGDRAEHAPDVRVRAEAAREAAIDLEPGQRQVTEPR